ncbi:CAP domain-containing protein [Tuber brumale]|nr:CAP domain-containing protein [Tuber brumale]
MRVAYTTILSAAFAASTIAFPFRGANQKRDEAVEIVTECTTVLVTEYMTAEPSPSPAPVDPVQVNGHNAPGQTDEYTKHFTFTKSHRPRPSSSPTSVPEMTPPPPVVTSPTPTPTPTSIPSTTLEAVVVTTPPPTSTSSTAPSPTAPSAPASGSFENEVLAAHNDKRALHGVPALTYDSTLANFATDVCSSCQFKHSGGPYGENLAAGYPSPAAAIQAWYDEENQYDYAAGQFSSATGHFTQMIWKNAKRMGCGIKECNGANGTPGKFLTCNYDTGNVIGQFVENVPPRK